MSPLRTLRRSRSRAKGMTLIEILVVVGIILILMALLGMGMRTAAGKARSKATKALIGRLQTALESYHAEFRDYPPDGYDAEVPSTDVNGVQVGSPARRVRGTASLIYFLCRPLVKISYMGDPTDPRSVVKRPSGPFMTLESSNVSRPEAVVGGQPTKFDPGYPWNANDYWGPSGPSGIPSLMATCEIIDSYFHPLVYDKVKTYRDPTDNKYFQASRFHFYGGSGTVSGTGVLGGKAHPDQEYLAGMPTTDDDEVLNVPDWPDYGAGSGPFSTASTTTHGDPRFTKWFNGDRYQTGVAGDPNTAGTGSHAPRNIGGYDLWSSGGSWTNTRDDITSWE